MLANQPEKSWIVFLSTYLPEKCGIATFANALSTHFNDLFAPAVDTKIIAMNSDPSLMAEYPKSVIGTIRRDSPEDYEAAAERLNALPQVKLVSIQHEFGIFGGDFGSDLLRFAHALTKPLTVTLHTVLPEPTARMKEIVCELSERAQRLIVMTAGSQKLLESIYGIDPKKIIIIPHGIHSVVFKPSQAAKKTLELPTRGAVLSTFGLLGPGKGIEYVINALPEVVARYPDTLYLIIGATHPGVVRHAGESYRESLQARVRELGLEKNVLFHDAFVKTSKLLTFLSATDIYIATPLDPNQAVSGTLSFALGSGRPVIATSFAQAKEDVTEETGILVDFKNSPQISAAILSLLDDSERRLRLGKHAYFKTRNMTWGNVAIAYMRLFARLVPEFKENEKRAPRITLRHLKKMTDDFGIIQFAHLTEPVLDSGYTVDDNARALRVAVAYYEQTEFPSALRLAEIYLNFLEFVQRPDGFFENYVTYERILSDAQNDTENLEEANARTMYALAMTATTLSLPHTLREQAQRLYEKSVDRGEHFISPRAIASYAKSLATFLSQEPNPVYLSKLKKACDSLVRGYEQYRTDEWEWFEPILAYSNAVIPEALLLGSKAAGEARYFDIGKKTLDFLIDNTFEDGMHVPIGQDGWFRHGGKRSKFDQQPEDAAATVAACKTMYEISGDRHYRKYAYRAFDWFLGGNVLGRIMYDQASGGCYDGLREKEVNLNQGAESTVSYLLSRLIL